MCCGKLACPFIIDRINENGNYRLFNDSGRPTRFHLKESILEAKVLRDQGMSNRSVMNRMDYAIFYAVLALYR